MRTARASLIAIYYVAVIDFSHWVSGLFAAEKGYLLSRFAISNPSPPPWLRRTARQRMF
jgi:hypothetical protein